MQAGPLEYIYIAAILLRSMAAIHLLHAIIQVQGACKNSVSISSCQSNPSLKQNFNYRGVHSECVSYKTQLFGGRMVY